MSIEENKAIIRRYTEACNKKDLNLLEKFVSPAYRHSTLQLQGREELKKFETMLWKAFPDLHETNDNIIAEGDKVCYRLKLTGTHTGELRDFPHPSGKKITIAPTGKKFTITGISIKRIADGKIIESLTVYDLLDIYKQLGVIEYKELPDENG